MCHLQAKRTKGKTPVSAGLPPGPLDIPPSSACHPHYCGWVVCSAKTANPGVGGVAAESGLVPLPGAHLYAEGIRRNLPWPRPRELLGPLECSPDGGVQWARLEQPLLPLRMPWSLSRPPTSKSFSFITFLIIHPQRRPASCDSGLQNGPIIWKRREQLKNSQMQETAHLIRAHGFLPAFSHQYFYSC